MELANWEYHSYRLAAAAEVPPLVAEAAAGAFDFLLAAAVGEEEVVVMAAGLIVTLDEFGLAYCCYRLRRRLRGAVVEELQLWCVMEALRLEQLPP